MAHEEGLIALVVALYKEGKTIGTIRKQTGVCRQTIYNWLRKAGENPDRYQTSAGDPGDHKLKKYAAYLIDRAVAKDEDIETALKKFNRYAREVYAKKTKLEVVVTSTTDREEINKGLREVAKQQAEMLAKSFDKDPLDEPKQPRATLADLATHHFPDSVEVTKDGHIRVKESPVKRDPVIEWGEKTLKDGALEAGFKASHEALMKDPEYAKVWTSGIDNDLKQEVVMDSLYDIEAEDAKKICTMCGNLMDTEFCCKWEG